MDKRTYESPMEWEYQSTGPMDPSSPFAQSTKKALDKNILGGASGFSSYRQNGFARMASSPSKALPPTPMQQQTPSIFSSARGPKPTAATPFRNATFTTPRRPFDIDVLSPVESSPAVTEASDLPETPDHDQSFDFSHMTMTPASVNRHRSPVTKRVNGKGEISKAIFPMRDKVRKRKRYNADRDVSGYRLPYIYPGEGDDSEYESDESTFQPNKPQGREKKNHREEGWFGGFLATIQRHPYAPGILGYWLSFAFSLVCVAGTLWVGWTILGGLRADFAAARSSVRGDIMQEMAKCRSHYIDNKCSPIEERLPAVLQLCDEWFICMNQDPDSVQSVRLGAKNIVEIINGIVDTMSYKTIALLVIFFVAFLFSGRSLYRSANYPDITTHTPPAYSQPHPSQQPAPQQIYWQAIQPQTPRHQTSRRLLSNDETPETDASPPKFKALLPPETPRSWRSPSKGERSRSPTKRY
ncbi:hypothetical protein F4861DRAFT_327663 [Xylaria intraflava]|nr:hypothetical protein F4861DRAFT_327663 [Xylaria intraflava]